MKYFIILLLTSFFISGYTYRDTKQNVVVTSNSNSNFVYQIYRQLSKCVQLVNYTLIRDGDSNKIFLNINDTSSGSFRNSRSYSISEQKLQEKNIFEILNLLNELVLSKVFYDWSKEAGIKVNVPQWLVYAYSSKNHRNLLFDSDFLLIPPFLGEQIAKGKKINIKTLLKMKFDNRGVIFSDTVSLYCELFFQFLKTLGGKESLKRALLLNNQEQFYLFYDEICKKKKNKNFQEAFEYYCLSSLVFMPYKLKAVSFSQFYKNNFVIGNRDVLSLLKSKKVDISDTQWQSMLQRVFKKSSLYSTVFSQIGYEFINNFSQIDYKDKNKIKFIRDFLKDKTKEWNSQYNFQHTRQKYFDNFSKSQRLEEKNRYLIEQFQYATSYEEYEKYLMEFSKIKK